MKLLTILLTACCLLSTASIIAQPNNDPIEIVHTKGFIFGHKVYRKCGIDMNAHQLGKYLSYNPRYASYGKAVVWNQRTSRILTTVGAGCILYPFAELIDNDKDPNWTMTLIGGGCIVASLPFRLIRNVKALQGVQAHNQKSPDTGGIDLQLNVSGQGIGIALQF